MSVNRRNFGEMILGGRALLRLTRNQLAEKASLAHDTVLKAEKGVESVAITALASIQKVLELGGIEFLNGTLECSLRVRETPLSGIAVCADPSMPSMARFITPVEIDSLYKTHPFGETFFIDKNKKYTIKLMKTDSGFDAAGYLEDRKVTSLYHIDKYIDWSFEQKYGDSYLHELIEDVKRDIRKLNDKKEN